MLDLDMENTEEDDPRSVKIVVEKMKSNSAP